MGTVVIGTVEGDLHDIGKSLVGMLLSRAGFDVVDFSTGVSADGNAANAGMAVERATELVG